MMLYKNLQVRDEDESILSNLKQYNCDQHYVDVLVSDFSNSIWHKNIQFDSIITDRKLNRIEFQEKKNFIMHNLQLPTGFVRQEKKSKQRKDAR